MKFSRPAGGRYLQNAWREGGGVFGGDVINAYNDGPPGPGLPPMGAFYELENLSPAPDLPPGGRLDHWSATVHLHGPPASLGRVAREALGLDLEVLPRI
jgi:hypothetical protein